MSIRNTLAAAALGLCSASALAATAANLPLGEAFPVHPVSAGEQQRGDVAVDASGAALIVWQDAGDIRLRRYAADGSPGAVQVVAEGAAAQRNPQVALAATGLGILVWEQDTATGDDSDIFARRLAADGSPLGEVFRVNTGGTGFQARPRVAMGDEGSFVITWERFTQEAQDGDIMARGYRSSGSAFGPEIRANLTVAGDQQRPDVAVAPNGHSIIVWQGNDDQDGDLGGIFARQFAFGMAPLTGEFAVNTTTERSQNNPVVALAADGGFVAAWRSRLQGGVANAVVLRGFNASAEPQTDEVLVAGASAEARPALSRDARGGTVVAWIEEAFAPRLVSQRLDAGLAVAAAQLVVDASTDAVVPASVALDADGDAWFTWTAGGSDLDQLARRVNGLEEVDLAVVITDSPDPVASAGDLNLAVTVSNNHDVVAPTGVPLFDSAIGLATGVAVNVQAPAGQSITAASASGWACEITGGTADCQRQQPLLPGASDSIAVGLALAAGSGDLVSQASVTADQFDASQDNNADSETTCAGRGSIGLDTASRAVNEALGRVSLTARRSGGDCGAASVSFATVGGSARSGFDFTAASGRLSWADGESGARSIELVIVDDAVDELAEQFSLRLTGFTGAAAGRDSTTINISDNDPAPTLSLAVDRSRVSEDPADVALVTLSLSAPRGFETEVLLSQSSVTGSGRALLNFDYNISALRLVIPAGQRTATAAFRPIDDTVAEGDEAVRLALPDGSSSVTVTIAANDAPVVTPTPIPTATPDGGTPSPTPDGGSGSPSPAPTPDGGGGSPGPSPTPGGGSGSPAPSPTPDGGSGSPAPSPTPDGGNGSPSPSPTPADDDDDGDDDGDGGGGAAGPALLVLMLGLLAWRRRPHA